MKIIEHELTLIKNEIKKGFLEPFTDEPVFDYIFSHSKMIRAFFGVLYLKTVGVVLTENIYKVFAVGELIHNASLLHDDVVDNSEQRRGNISAWKKYNSKIAVLLGDYLLNYAVSKIQDMDSRVILNFQNCINRMCLAEFKQYSLRNKNLSIDEYIGICQDKTGVLFSAILESCLILSGEKNLKTNEFAENFGIYFQLKNDMQDYSLKQDKKNKIHTASDILGIEKVNYLIDNYKRDLNEEARKLPENKYRNELEGLIKNV